MSIRSTVQRWRSPLVVTLAAITAITVTSSPARAVPGESPGSAGRPAAVADQGWPALQAKLNAITGHWTDESYAGATSSTMPNTAILGNGDVGITSYGRPGVKTFLVSKNDFWNGNPSPHTLPIGGVTLKGTASQVQDDEALGATATASSVLENYTPDRAVNGQWSANSGYQGWVSSVGKPQWIALDLGSVQTIARYIVKNDSAARPGQEANNTKDMQVQTSTDGHTWTAIDTVSGNSAAIIDRDLATPVQTRYIRFYLTTPTQESTQDSIDNPRGRIGQIELYPEPSTVANPTPSPPANPFSETENILDGSVDTSMYIDNTPLSMHTWLAANQNLLVTTLTSNGTTPVTLQSSTWAGSAAGADGYPATSGVQGDTMWATRTTKPGHNFVSSASLATRVLGAQEEATPTSSDNTAETTFTLQPGQTVQFVTAVAGGGPNNADAQPAASQLAQAQDGGTLATLEQEDVSWWRNYWLESYVDLNDPVLERYYYGAQYIIGSASRSGKQAPALYGPWATTDSPSFSGDYHLNYNAQANYYGVYSSNRAELALPFFDEIDSYLPEAENRAQHDLTRVKPSYITPRFPSGGVPRGVLFPVGIGPFGTTTDDQYHQQVSDSLFTATQYISYYDYTQNLSFLRQEAYPYLSLVLDFFSNYLQWNADTQQYELWDGPHEDTWGKDPSDSVGILKDVLESMLSYSKTLGLDDEKRGNWMYILHHLPAQAPTIVYNGKTVFALAEPGTITGDTRDIHPGDNTVNLEFIHPGNQLGLDSDPSQLQIARDTVNAMNSWGQNNSFPKVFTQAARVGYPAAQLISQLDSQITKNQAPNLRIADPFHGIEKSGATEAVNDLLLQRTSEGVIHLFPVWPAGKDAAFTRLRTTGAFVVTSDVHNNVVGTTEITSEAGGQVKLQDPWPGQTIQLTADHGATRPVKPGAGDIVTFQTVRGVSYTLSPAPSA